MPRLRGDGGIGSDGPAVSQDVSEGIVDTTVGKWLLTLEDGSLACHATLEKVETIGCRVVTKVRPCGPPWHDELAAWEFSDAGIVLRDHPERNPNLSRAGGRTLENPN